MRHIVLVLAGLLLCAPAGSQMYGPSFQQCGNGATVAIVNCVDAQTKIWDRRLNSAYRAALERADTGQRAPLQAAQRLWIRYRDANCGFYAAGEGSVRAVAAAECMRAMTEQRACELEATKHGDGGSASHCK